ncbi:Peroxidase [Heracleum sosnowskyi]|uniref:peroxidase n=1 Tax=Heracleum sosnowskyi TaxID=360622 RepID=A0AAD8IRR1_9APIA|nr:Peroxidase [Heracleum sosnowskyi]
MASLTKILCTILFTISLVSSLASAQLSANFYARSCPNVQTLVRTATNQAVSNQPRQGASILRLFFHDCFVNGCDGSVLLDDVSGFTGEKTANANRNSARGFDVIDTIKTRVEAACNATVSCADILALSARDSVVALGGPSWTVLLGRRDARTASLSAANAQIPAPTSSLSTLLSMFSSKGLNARDMTALSELRVRQIVQLLVELFNNGSTDAQVRSYSTNNAAFLSDFTAAMIKMGNIRPLTGTNGEIRRNCRRRN